jgi:hypothetical protein
MVNSSAVSVAALAGGAAMGALVASSLRTQDALAKTADRINATTEGLASLHHLAVLNGSSTENMNKGLEKMTRSIGEYSRGTGTARLALEELNITSEELAGMNADEQYTRISSAIAGVADQSLQASYAADIFGRSGVELLNTMRQGEEGIRAAREEAELLGIAVSRVDTAKAEMANDSIFRAKQAIAGMGNQITSHVGPIIEDLMNQFTDATREAGGMGEVVKSAFATGVKVVGVFADGIHGIKAIFEGVKLAAYGLGSVLTMVVSGAVSTFIDLGNTITSAVLAPIKYALEGLAMISDDAAEWSNTFNSVYDQITNVEPPKALTDAVDYMLDGTREVATNLHNLLMEDLPSDVLKGRFDEILAAAEVRAQEIANNAGEALGLPSSGEDGGGDESRFEADLERLRSQAESRAVLLQEQYDADLALLNQAKEREKITIEQYERMKENIIKNYSDRKKQMESRDARFSVQTMLQSGGKVFGAFANSSKKMFKMQKAASLAQAMVRIPSAVIESFNNGGGYPWGLVPAGAMALEGASQVASIKSQSLGGGGSVKTPSGGSSPSMPSIGSMKSPDFGSQFREQDDTPAKQINFHIKNMQGNDAKKIFEEFKEIIRESDEVLIEPGTRQAMELAG